MGASFLRGGLGPTQFSNWAHAREQSLVPMDIIVGQPNPTPRPTTTNAYGLQSNGFYFPKSPRLTHLPPQSQLPSIHSPNFTSGFPQTRLPPPIESSRMPSYSQRSQKGCVFYVTPNFPQGIDANTKSYKS